MPSSELIRWGGIAAMLSGVAFIVDNLYVLAIVMTGGPRLQVILIVAKLLALGGMVGFHALQKQHYGRIGRAGFWTVVIASLAQILSSIVVLAGAGGAALQWLVLLEFPVGDLVMWVGFVLYGVATLQARVLPRWCGLAFIIAVPISIILLGFGNLGFGIVWLALGYVLWSRRGTAAEQPSRVVS
jgi:hypothetical protein